MSTILDALKKSEQERKLSELPELSSMPLPEEESDSSKIWWVLAVLAILVTAIIVYLVTSSTQSEDMVNAPIEPQSNAQSFGQEPYVITEDVYEYVDLSERQREIADSLNVNVVSYTENIAKRFVMIDSGLYRVGNTVTLQNGKQVEVRDIESNSVVFRYEDTLFRLSP